MKSLRANRRRWGFTGWDLLTVVGALVMIGTVAWSQISKPRRRGCGLSCVSNLKQVGLAFRMWANDHNDQFPQAVSTNLNGSMEWIGRGEMVQHFLALSNELVSPKVLACPEDKSRSRTTAWESLRVWNVSYFVGLDGDESKPATILSGDREVVGGGEGGLRTWADTNRVEAGWRTGLHRGCGNVGMGDGSVAQVDGLGLEKLVRSAFERGARQVRVELPGL